MHTDLDILNGPIHFVHIFVNFFFHRIVLGVMFNGIKVSIEMSTVLVVVCKHEVKGFS